VAPPLDLPPELVAPPPDVPPVPASAAPLFVVSLEQASCTSAAERIVSEVSVFKCVPLVIEKSI
jgi:hypothetical protein